MAVDAQILVDVARQPVFAHAVSGVEIELRFSVSSLVICARRFHLNNDVGRIMQLSI